MQVRAALPIGSIVQGRYIVEELLGQGGFSAVYLVRDQRVRHNLFALKEAINSSKRERERFTFEGELLRRLDHPALPRVYRAFEDDKHDRAYILMDYVEGPNLEKLRQQQPEKRFSLPQVLAIMAPIVDAVAYLQRQQPPIIHRDIKPANIIVPTAGDEAVLVDFGIAKEYDQDATTSAIRHASPGYGAPEQYGKGTNTRTDIYGLGATIYALLTGVVPADALYRLTQLGSNGADPLEPVDSLAPDIPIPVAEAIQRAMAMNSNDRFPTVEQFWQALTADPMWQQAPAPLIPPTPPYPPAIPAQAVKRPAVIERPEAPRSQRGGIIPLLLAFFVLLILLAFGTGLWFYIASQSSAGTATPTPTLHSKATATALPTSRPTATAQPTSTPTSTPGSGIPNVAGSYNGTIRNTTVNQSAPMSLSIQQNGGSISGNFTVTSPLQGSNPFTGSVDATNHIQFTVQSYKGNAPLFFSGTVQQGGILSGTYCSLDATGHCNPNAGGSGTWKVTLVSPGSSLTSSPFLFDATPAAARGKKM